jgi:hypothetical protein
MMDMKTPMDIVVEDQCERGCGGSETGIHGIGIGVVSEDTLELWSNQHAESGGLSKLVNE